MCGICGFIDARATRSTLHAMNAAVARRGPDGTGIHFVDGVGLGHRRLAIIDLSPQGLQPMRRGNLLITFNGEIYNYAEIRAELSALGDTFESSSDTEVILKAFERWGRDCAKRFIGIFAFAIYDERARELHLCRDRPGVKPLFYCIGGNRIAFASTLSALKPYLREAATDTIDSDALSEFLSLGYVGQERSILRDVRKLPPAHWLTFRDGKVELLRYWDVEFDEDASWNTRPLNDVVDELEELAINSFRYRMVADVPIGVFLSAGVDSSLVTAILARHHGQLRTFTIGFEEPTLNEAPEAELIARHLGTRHHSRSLTSRAALNILDHYGDMFDEPHGDPSAIATAFVSQLASEHGVKVVLSADGGDELFGGYTRYVELIRRWRQSRVLGRAGRAAARTGMNLRATFADPHEGERWRRQAALLEGSVFLKFMQRRLSTSSSTYLARLLPSYREPILPPDLCGTLVNQMGEWDFKNYLPDDILVKVDRATMYHSLEGREPLLDHRLVEFAAKLPAQFKIKGGTTKVALKTLLGRYLPPELYELPKRGFAPPIIDWMRNDLRRRIADVLAEPADEFDRKAMSGLLERYRAGKTVNFPLLWNLFAYHQWRRSWTAT
jgi:asparagine synthase (glutamine-hydrolysing)